VSSPSLALTAALGCAACYGVGSVLEQIGARREATATSLDPRLLIRLAGQLPYLAGLGLDGLGWVLSLVALRSLPLFLVQSAVAASIAVTALTARILLRTKLDTGDRLAILVIVFGLIVLALAAAPDDARPVGALFRGLLVAGVPVLAVGATALAKVEVERGALGLAAVAGLASVAPPSPAGWWPSPTTCCRSSANLWPGPSSPTGSWASSSSRSPFSAAR
jgi:drug/metabolite transporter (DMT)-like permease